MDAIGNLVGEGSRSIDWTVYGKIKELTASGEPTISYGYDAAGNRISKTVGSAVTWYVRDAQGNTLTTYAYDGTNLLADGTQLIAKAPHIAPMAWLHAIYPPLVDAEVDGLQQKIGIEIPVDYRSFFKVSNGLKVFSTTFCLYGLRRNRQRTIENVWQPFDINRPNVSERPQNAKVSFFFIGGYDWDGSLLFMDEGKVFLCDREDATPKYEWNSFCQLPFNSLQSKV